MKGRNLFLTGIIAIVAGLLMYFFRYSLESSRIAVFAGVLFVAAGILNMTVFLGARDRKGRARQGALGIAFGWIASAAAVVLGLAMLIFRGTFVPIVGFMFGVLVSLTALFQFFLLIFGSRPAGLSKWFFLFPIALVGAAVYVFSCDSSTPPASNELTMVTVSAISFVVFGAGTLIEGLVIGNANRRQRHAGTVAAPRQDSAPAAGTADSVPGNQPSDSPSRDTATDAPRPES